MVDHTIIHYRRTLRTCTTYHAARRLALWRDSWQKPFRVSEAFFPSQMATYHPCTRCMADFCVLADVLTRLP